VLVQVKTTESFQRFLVIFFRLLLLFVGIGTASAAEDPIRRRQGTQVIGLEYIPTGRRWCHTPPYLCTNVP